jgi:hypothetical protein
VEDIVGLEKRYGARAYLNGDGVIQVKQTVKDADDDAAQYLIDYDANGNQRQRTLDSGINQDEAVGQAVRLALHGKLGAHAPGSAVARA